MQLSIMVWIVWFVILSLIILLYIFSYIPKWFYLAAYLMVLVIKIVELIKGHKCRIRELENKFGRNLEKINQEMYNRGLQDSGIKNKKFTEELEHLSNDKIKEERNFHTKIFDALLLK